MLNPDPNFTTSISVDQTPNEVFAAINNVRGWWSENIEGSTANLGDEWKYRYKDTHRCTMKVTEMVPNKKVAWLVVDNYFDFTQDRTEWTNTKIVFEISTHGNKTEIRFTHEGLVPAYECFDVCSNAWGMLINGNLRKLVGTGKSQPDIFA